MSKLFKVLFVLGSLLIIIVIFGIILLEIVLNGGVGGLMRNLKPNVNPNNPKVVKERNNTINEINSSFSDINKLGYFKEYATSTHDRCHRGESTWKRIEVYSNHCAYKITKYYGFNTDFKQTMLNFEKSLYKLGWKRPDYADDNPMEYLMGLYDSNYGSKLLYGDGLYDISNLPSSVATYSKNDQSLKIEFAEKSTKDFSDIDYAQRETSGIAVSRTTFEHKDFPSLPDLLNKITNDSRYVIVVAISKGYFEN
jgi:hypothetical protein